jgi:RNA 2',3'-cyclic 3'-phosphodiesterase
VRLFYAALPDAETRRLIAAAAATLELGHNARRVPCENYHLTLAFVGEVSNAQAASLRTIEPPQVPAFTVRFDAYEHWPKSEVLVMAANECPPALLDLQCKLGGALAHRHIDSDCRQFRPHVTIARKVVQAPVHQAMSGFLWPVTGFQLVRSARSDAGSVYTVLERWSLLDKPVRGE